MQEYPLTALEKIFSRTFQALEPAEKKSILGEFSRKFPSSLEASQIAGLFPFFLSGKKWPERGFVPDLAALEWALRLAEGAPELPPVGFERVITATEPQWFSAQFRFDPAHAVMVSDWPLDEIALNPSAAHERKPGKYLIYRNGGPQVRSLDENEARLLEALALGVPLGVILDSPGGPEFDAFLFQEWIQSGLLREIRWSEKAQKLSPSPSLQ